MDVNDRHIRYLPAAMAKAMVDAGSAEIANANGKVRSIRLVATATSFARRIGEPTPGWNSTPFVVREKLDSGFVVWAASRAMPGLRVVSGNAFLPLSEPNADLLRIQD